MTVVIPSDFRLKITNRNDLVRYLTHPQNIFSLNIDYTLEESINHENYCLIETPKIEAELANFRFLNGSTMLIPIPLDFNLKLANRNVLNEHFPKPRRTLSQKIYYTLEHPENQTNNCLIDMPDIYFQEIVPSVGVLPSFRLPIGPTKISTIQLAPITPHATPIDLTYFEDIAFRSIDIFIVTPKTRGRIFVHFVPKKLTEAAENARLEATKKRAPDDFLSALFYLLLAKQNWDVRIHGLDVLLAVYPVNKKPYPFQFEGIKFLTTNDHALLADEMGLGKTLQAILAFRARIHAGTVQRVLVVCPKSLLGTWFREISEWAPELSITLVHGKDRDAAVLRPHHVYITNYESIANTFCECTNGDEFKLSKKILPFDLLVIDEAQNYKNQNSKKHCAIEAIETGRRWGLTGTPLENSIDDYYSVWNVLAPHINVFNMQVGTLLKTTKAQVLRREKKHVLFDLPEKVERVQYIELDGEQLKRYRRVENMIQKDVSELVDSASYTQGNLRMHIFSRMSELKQLCICDPESGESAKMEWIKEQLEEMHPYGVENIDCDKALIFTQYPNLVWEEWKLYNRIIEYSPKRYDGSLNDVARQSFVNLFQSDERLRVAFMGLKAGATGLTLTRASHVIFLDSWWNPAVMDQAAARVHRIGQKRMCFITTLIAKDTIEQRVMVILQRKRGLFDTIMSEIKSGHKKAEDLANLENALTMDEMLEALGLAHKGVHETNAE